MASAASEISETAQNGNISNLAGLNNGDENDPYELDYISPGAKLSSERTFTHKGASVSLTPVIMEFRRILQNKTQAKVIPGVSNRELLHAVVGLYSVSLSEMTPDVLYSTVCDRWARTILLLRDVKDTIDDLEKRRESQKQKLHGEATAKKEVEKEDSCNKSQNNSEQKSERTSIEAGKDVYEEEEVKPGKFDDVYSDTDSEESEDEDNEEDFSEGINSFLESVDRRRTSRLNHKGPLTTQHVGIENRLVGAITFKKFYCKGERVVHITLVAVRKRFRKWGIGSFMLMQAKDVAVVGPYDAVVVHADNSATEFFERYGFTDDLVINSKWSDLAEQFTNCTLMCYLPPFTGQTRTGSSIPELDIIAMEREIKNWQKTSVEAYKAEVCCVNRLKHEIVKLRALVSTQEELMANMFKQIQTIQKEKFIIEKEYLQYRLLTSKFTVTDEDLADEEDDEESTDLLIQQLKKHARVSVTDEKLPYCHMQDCKDFNTATKDFYDALKKDSTVINSFEVKMITKASNSAASEEAWNSRMSDMHEANCIVKLYYCGSLNSADRVSDIIKHGFTDADITEGEYGKGLYFSMYPSKAAQFSALGKLVMSAVNLGKTESVLQKDAQRVSPSNGYDSIIVPGRLLSSETGDAEKLIFQEYIVFDIRQARPLHLLEYSVSYT